ncbi:MAG TPA: uroporphyrinogen decarboxylase family protein [Candidatus Brocadiia bacterium]|nr:uroporphyrinogen decarboxylase family protein [Candidatus Brocadiia bacterium]
MTHRERFRTVLQGRRPDRTPMVTRLDLWLNAAISDNAVPAEYAGLKEHEIEARLGMGRSARFRGFLRHTFPTAQVREERRGGETVKETTLGRRTLRQVSTQSAQNERAGISPHITEYPLKTAEDYRVMAGLWETLKWETRPEAFEAFSAEIGENGLPMLILGPCPAHAVMLHDAGYENIYLHLNDFPDQVENLIRVMEARFEEWWPAVAATSAELVLHGAHWSGDMTPPPLFKRFFLPYFQRFTAAMRAAGKRVAFHADADLRGLLDLVLESGMDVADCFASAPLVSVTLAEARQRWGKRVVIWGGVPSTVLDPGCPEAEFRQWLDGFLADISDGRGFIAGVSDNFMPGSDIRRLAEVARAVAAIVPAASDS